MKSLSRIVFFCVVGVAYLSKSLSAAPPAKGEEKVTQLDGSEHIGKVEVVDDYTIRISSDSGILNIPIALLGEKDFQKYGFQNGKDRSSDGRLWYERKQALEKERQGESEDADSLSEAKPKSSQNKNEIEISLSQIQAFQPVIELYEQTLASSKKSEEPASTRRMEPPQETPSHTASRKQERLMFPAAPGSPFSSGMATPLQPAVSAGASAVQSATDVPGLSVAPGN